MLTTIEQYRKFDLTILGILAVIAESMAILLHNSLPGAGFYISFSMVIIIMSLIRWGEFGVTTSLIVVIPGIILSGDYKISLILTQLISHSAIIVVPIIYRKITTETWVKSSYLFLSYVMLVFCTLIFTNAICASLFGYQFRDVLTLLFAQQLFSMIMSYLVLLLLKRQKELMINMETYFNERDKEKTK